MSRSPPDRQVEIRGFPERTRNEFVEEYYIRDMFGAIEAGGTKFICGVGTGPHDLETGAFPTTVPAETMPQVIAFFAGCKVQGVGIGSFGPVDLRPESGSYGKITSTPKRGWANFDLVGEVERALGVPATFDTDVNGAIRGEVEWGAARGLTDAVYLTVGTGVGGGAYSGGKLVHGLIHPEMGHLRIPHDWGQDPFAGTCPYHGDCLEGLAAGPALQARWGVPGYTLAPDHAAWPLEARYLALALANICVVSSPQRIILGGGVMQNEFLFPMIRKELTAILGGYLQHPTLLDDMESFVVPPQLGNRVGVLGALAMAKAAAEIKI